VSKDLCFVLADLIYARKEFQKMKLTRADVRQLVEKIQGILNELEEILAIGDLRTHPYTYDYLDKGFIKICEAAVYLHRVQAILEEEKKEKRLNGKALGDEE